MTEQKATTWPEAWEQIKAGWAEAVDESVRVNGFKDRNEAIGDLVSTMLLSLLAYRAARRDRVGLAIYWTGARIIASQRRGRRQVMARAGEL